MMSSDSPHDGAVLAIRPRLADDELNELFGAAWPDHRPTSFAPVLARSLAWVGARRADRLVGFVNVAGDGGAHAFILDTTVHPDERRRGLGVRLVRAAAAAASSSGAEWLHVDYEPHLESFYAQCGFRRTTAGVMPLTGRRGASPSPDARSSTTAPP